MLGGYFIRRNIRERNFRDAKTHNRFLTDFWIELNKLPQIGV